MKSKAILLIFLLVVVTILCLPPGALAVERNFGAGSLIIPMDKNYQPEDDGGVLEAYGLVYALLNHVDAQGNNDIAIYWIINPDKTDIAGIDMIVEVANAAILKDLGVEAVVEYYKHDDKTEPLTYKGGDNLIKVSYWGAPFVIDEEDVEKAKTIIKEAGWIAVDVHEAQVPFKAVVHREMRGTPPRIALMNNKEDDDGNADILESYLRLAGICSDVYDILTPNQIRDGVLQNVDYDFLWAPHWDGYKNYDEDLNSNGKPDVEDIVIKISEFLQSGNGLLAECASIEVFEHSENGHFLTDKGFGHNGGTNDEEDIIYNDVTYANSQVGDFTYAPEGGHLHNWRPFVYGDQYNFDERPDAVPASNPRVKQNEPSVYNDTVTRFTIDNTGWDYYVGGYAYGDRNNGYVVYLGGHKYADCKGELEVSVDTGAHTFEIEFTKDMSDEVFTLLFKYNSGSSTTVTFTQDDLTAVAGDPLIADLTTGKIDKKKKLKDATLRNKKDTAITVDSITISWTGGNADQSVKKIIDNETDVKYLDKGDEPSGTEISTAGLIIEGSGGGDSASCTNNADCEWKNIAGVRYVLNTLFNIKFQLTSVEYSRSSPIVRHPYLYQGSFEYPSYYGHFRRYDVTKTLEEKVAEWDTADGHILSANDGNSNGRKVYTGKNNWDGTWSKVNFDASSIDEMRYPLDVTPSNGDDTDEIAVITRLRGKDWNTDTWVERTNKLGAIMHSAPAIVECNSRFPNRDETAYVGDLYGMLHGIKTSTGGEKWAYIPRNLLGKLQNDRTDSQAVQDFAAVDASPTVKDIFYDHDDNPSTDFVWRTILVCPQGFGGDHIFALDVSDPNNFSVLWEASDDYAPGGGMGYSYRAALNKVKWPIKDDYGQITGYKQKWVVYTACGYATIAEDHGGINVFAFDLVTGQKLWNFSSAYSDSVNDIPGAVTLFDMDGDNLMDRIYVGDMNGRMWELDAIDGTNPNGTEEVLGIEKEIPLVNCGVGNPISVSPAIGMINGRVVLIFGTGGADWASDDQAYSMYCVDVTNKKATKTYADGAASVKWKVDLAVGEKVWSAPSIAAGQLYFATSFGSMESGSPADDVAGIGGNTGNIYSLNVNDGSETWKISNVGKVRGSVYVDRQHVYASTIDGKIIQVGGDDFSAGTTDNVIMMNWREL